MEESPINKLESTNQEKSSKSIDYLDAEYEKMEKEKRYHAEIYFKSIVDYSKWVATISIAILALIPFFISNIPMDNRGSLFFPIGLIIGSLILAGMIILLITQYWRDRLEYYGRMTSYFAAKSQKEKGTLTIPDEKIAEYGFKILDSTISPIGVIIRNPKFYGILILLQLYLTTLGLICLIVGLLKT